MVVQARSVTCASVHDMNGTLMRMPGWALGHFNSQQCPPHLPWIAVVLLPGGLVLPLQRAVPVNALAAGLCVAAMVPNLLHVSGEWEWGASPLQAD